ncbi:unnamed protein product, partial [Ilex paraguariensis]
MAPQPVDKQLLANRQAQRTSEGGFPTYKRPKFISSKTRSKSSGSPSLPSTPPIAKGHLGERH